MTPRLSLKYTKGEPTRMRLVCSYADKNLAKAAGEGTATWAAKAKRWHYPLEPIVFENLLNGFPNLKVADEVWDYFDRMRQRQEALFAAVTDYSPLHENDYLWPFQRASVRALGVGKRIVLGHPMGTGKTVIGAKAIEYYDCSRTIIICPNSVKWSWVDHLHDWADRDDIYMVGNDKAPKNDTTTTIIKGTKDKRTKQLEELLHCSRPFILIMGYAQARIHQKSLQEVEYDCLIVDEAHRIKNWQATQSQAVNAISKQCVYVWLMTGTLIRNDYVDVSHPLSLCDPKRFTGKWPFVNLFMHTVPGIFGGTDIVGLKNHDKFNAMLSAYVFRKTKEELLPDLPPKIPVPYPLSMNSKQAKAYETMEKEFILYVQKRLDSGELIEEVLQASEVISQIIRLRQICLTPAIVGGVADSAKLDALRDMLPDLMDGGHRVVIFSWFRRFLPFIEQILRELDIPYGEIVGGQSASVRHQVQEDLTNDKIKVVIGTIDSMGEGMNLQAADTAIFCDRTYVPAVNEQAEDRLWRGEIKHSPRIITLYHPDTIEDAIRSVCRRKERIANETVGQVEMIREMLQRKGV